MSLRIELRDVAGSRSGLIRAYFAKAPGTKQLCGVTGFGVVVLWLVNFSSQLGSDLHKSHHRGMDIIEFFSGGCIKDSVHPRHRRSRCQ